MRKENRSKITRKDTNGKKEKEWSTLDQLATKYRNKSQTTEASPEEFPKTRYSALTKPPKSEGL